MMRTAHHIPTEYFTVSEPQNPSLAVSERLKIRRSTDFQALKIMKWFGCRFKPTLVRDLFIHFGSRHDKRTIYILNSKKNM